MGRVKPAAPPPPKDGWSSIRPVLLVAGKLLPGLRAVFLLALVARLVSGVTDVIPDAVLALILGAFVKNKFRVPVAAELGIRFTHRYLLRTAIILLGASLSFGAIVGDGGKALPVILVCVVLSFSLCLLFARFVKLPDRVGTLLGAGTAICGATAIVTVGPLVAATEAEIAYAIGTIFTFNALAVVVYPFIGQALQLSDFGFGAWAGTAVNDTSAAVATGLIYGDGAGQVATVVKLTRTVLLVPLAVGLGLVYGLRQGNTAGQKVNVWKMMPWFVFGFLGMAVLNTLGSFSADVVGLLTGVAKFLIVMVLAGVGLTMSLEQIRKMGARPLLIGLLVGTIMAVASLGLVYVLGLAG